MRRNGRAVAGPAGESTRRRARLRTLLAATTVALALAPASVTRSAATDAGEGGAVEGRQVFAKLAQPACSACHALADAGSTAEVGPSLDELRPDRARVEKAVRDGVGVMPPYEDKLSDAQIRAVAEYVAAATGASR